MNYKLFILLLLLCIIYILYFQPLLLKKTYSGLVELFSNKTIPLLINVGLPRTGTQSLDDFLTNNGYNCAHIGYGENDHTELDHFKQTGKGKIFDFMCHYQMCGDSPYYGLIEALITHYPTIKLIATYRDRESWLNSMNKHKAAGGSFLRNYYGNNQPLSVIYDNHYDLCRKYNIPLIDLNDDDTTKINIIYELLGDSNIQKNTSYSNIDNLGNGLKISIRHNKH